MSSRIRKESTNPFDDEEANAEQVEENDRSGDDDPSPDLHRQRQRKAPLNFSKPFDDVEQPALTFDRANRSARAPSLDENGLFISPLQSAMHEMNESAAQRSALHDDNDDNMDELSALLPPKEDRHPADYHTVSSRSSQRYRLSVPKEIHTGTDPEPPHLPSHPQARRRPNKTKKGVSHIVMTELAPSDSGNEIMEYKYILLEDLGTASSWFILLLPYITFAMSMLLEYATSLSVSTLGPIHASELCGVERIYEVIHRLPINDESGSTGAREDRPCYASFSMKTSNDDLQDKVWSGTAFDSGTLGSMPVIGTYLYGDVIFTNLSIDALAMVAQGRIKASVVILEQTSASSTMNDTQHNQSMWKPIFVSPSSTLSMTCSRNWDDLDHAHFDCKSPDLISMAFSMPETAVYTGGELRFFVLYEESGGDAGDSTLQPENLSSSIRRNATITTNAYGSKNDTMADFDDPILLWTTMKERIIQNPSVVLGEMISSSSYTIRYRSNTTVLLDTFMRTFSFIFSIGFIIFWCRQMGIRCLPHWRRIFCGLLGKTSREDSAKKYWWEDPWVLFPERYYIVLLLISLLLVQEPFLVAIYFLPHRRSNTMHMIADAAMGIGVQGILFVYLCLLEGLKFHTAQRSKRRAERQRQALQLRRAVKLVRGFGNRETVNSPAAVEDYYNEFGDTDGSAFTSHLRLPNDPSGDGWADFLLPKLCLWLIGVSSASVSAYCRFCGGQEPSENAISNAPATSVSNVEIAYIVCSVIQVLTILLWIYLIVAALTLTGESLKREPFLATRPAQLSYRVLFAHTALVITALLVSFILYIGHLQNDWHGQTIEVSVAQREKSRLGLAVGALLSSVMKFPYSGTAATVGFGRLLCVTVEILITAFIFLPAHSMDIEDDDACEDHQGAELRNFRKKKRDKRSVVHLAKESRTFRIFPCPIQRIESLEFPLQESMYQIYKGLHTDRNMRKRGLVSIGPYTPVFCNEIACWLNEASWQAYYTPPGSSHMTEKDDFIGWMNLEALGLRLEGYVYDERTNAQALIATNVVSQVDGEADSIIVVAFRGTSNVAHMQIDIRMRQVSLRILSPCFILVIAFNLLSCQLFSCNKGTLA
jgi:hypothetical protein